jgi:hypothetical protein
VGFGNTGAGGATGEDGGMDGLEGLPVAQAPAGLRKWIGVVREALAAPVRDGLGRPTAFVVEVEPRYYDDQSWKKGSSRCWERRPREPGRAMRMSDAMMTITGHPEYAKFKAAVSQAAMVLSRRSYRYVLDIGPTHVAMYAGSDECGGPILIEGGGGMREADADPDLLDELGRIGSRLGGGTEAFGGSVPEAVAREAAEAFRHARDADKTPYVTMLPCGATALHLVQADGRGRTRFGKLLALHVPAIAAPAALPLFAAAGA